MRRIVTTVGELSLPEWAVPPGGEPGTRYRSLW